MELFYTDPEQISDSEARFDKFESQHILKTLRKKTGDEIQFTNGRGYLYSGIIEQTKPVLKVRPALLKEAPPAVRIISLAVGFIRPARMDFIIEKGTELGVQKFYLLATENSNYFTPNISRWVKIARQGMKQSLHLFLPEIIAVKSLADLFPLITAETAKIVFTPGAELSLSEILYHPESLSSKNILFLIGPEGGLTVAEIELVRQHNFLLVSLGTYRLRSETAAIVAAAAAAGLLLK